MKKILLIVFMLLSVSIFADTEHYFRFKFDKSIDMISISKSLSIDNIRDGYVYAYSNDAELANFRSMSIEFEVLTNPSLLCDDVKMMDKTGSLRTENEWNAYPTYDAYIEMMNSFATDYPDLCSIMNIGKTVKGKDLLVAKLTADNGKAKPTILLTSSMHGDETTGYVMMLRLIDYLLTRYGIDDEITQIIDNTVLYINPLHNPDGTYKTSDLTVSGATRFNANYVDLNRNFPDPFGSQNPTGIWQPETVAFMEFAKTYNTIMSMNLHGGVELVNYPWDSKKARHADDTWYANVSRQFATLAQNNSSSSNYFTDENNGITNGYDWYYTSGSRQDYVVYYTYSREFTAEISTTKLVKASDLPKYWEYLKDSFIYFIKQVQYGIRGQVTDVNTGEPVKAKVFIKGHDQDNSFVYSDSENGCFFRVIDAGVYTLEISADGYKSPVVVENVVVEDDQFIELKVEIGDKKENGIESTDSDDEIALNVYINGDYLIFDRSLSGSVFIRDIMGRNIEIGTVNESNNYQIAAKLEPGIYIVSVVSCGKKINKKIICKSSNL